MAKGFGRNMLTPLKGSRKRNGGRLSSNASLSVISDNDTLYSAEGQQSVAAITVDSQITIKASNKHFSTDSSSDEPQKKESKPWRTIKRLVGKKTPPDTPNKGPALPVREESESERSGKSSNSSNGILWSPRRKRILSLDAMNPNKPPSSTRSSGSAASANCTGSVRNACELDLAIRGRLDGVDTMSLGPAGRLLTGVSVEPRTVPTPQEETQRKESRKQEEEKQPPNQGDSELNLDPLSLSFTGKSISCTPVDVVFDMLWASDGKESPELIFEGYNPGGTDRWTVKLEDEQEVPTLVTSDDGERASSPERSKSKSSHDDDESTAVMTEDGSPIMPAHHLWDQMWGEDGPPPLPCHMQQAGNESDKDEVLQLAAACSVPIDLDEDTFMIEKPEHLRAVHDLTMVPVQGRRFESALIIFKNLLTGLTGSSGEKLEHVVGVTHHNIGILHMCQGNFGAALASFQEAVTVRKDCLPHNHPDIAVSLARQATAYFALEEFEKALNSFTSALDLCPNEDMTRAKLLNSIGVVHSFRQEYSDALKSFTAALEIQRVWLEGPVRRESLIYDASVTLSNMGKIYLLRGDYDLSYFVYEEACVLQTTCFRNDHHIVLTSLENMARVLAKRDEYEKASQLFSSTYRSTLNRFGEESDHCIEMLGMMGYVHAKLLDFNLALTHLGEVSKWQSKHLPESHPAIRITRETITNVTSCKDGEASLWV